MRYSNLSSFCLLVVYKLLFSYYLASVFFTSYCSHLIFLFKIQGTHLCTVVLMGEKSMNMSKGVVEAGDGGRKVSSMSG